MASSLPVPCPSGRQMPAMIYKMTGSRCGRCSSADHAAVVTPRWRLVRRQHRRSRDALSRDAPLPPWGQQGTPKAIFPPGWQARAGRVITAGRAAHVWVLQTAHTQSNYTPGCSKRTAGSAGSHLGCWVRYLQARQGAACMLRNTHVAHLSRPLECELGHEGGHQLLRCRLGQLLCTHERRAALVRDPRLQVGLQQSQFRSPFPPAPVHSRDRSPGASLHSRFVHWLPGLPTGAEGRTRIPCCPFARPRASSLADRMRLQLLEPMVSGAPALGDRATGSA